MEHLKYSGIAGVVVYWLFVAWSIDKNPWFSFWSNALSDLGSPEMAMASWIYNYGLIVTAVFMVAFSVYLILSAGNKLQTVGGAYISISAIFLALIGVFHAGTRPHSFVSTYFFVQFFLGMLLYGVGSKEKAIRYGSVLLFALAVLGTLVNWPSVALIETYEIALIMAFTLLVAIKD
ncbi:DUF998 domain-containing protein [Thermococcus thioreducens]|uniref:Hypothetical membrane protein n=1 Tax=Thermococcus thioreducens TaxID=277988 RepID=A0A0Q2XLG4_9EURY|nr:DUF998 domain-containing protein [Thermococcus thioreducens]ASJ12679.1 hypothetical protein A3L14_07175 [Thermococcus thioreducens]KQH82012.1 hypothetical protein AMR53_07950 [Thermococcus thioreducens]SEV86832.1 hypothetical membrane protein [Thermococcus thioreducens]